MHLSNNLSQWVLFPLLVLFFDLLFLSRPCFSLFFPLGRIAPSTPGEAAGLQALDIRMVAHKTGMGNLVHKAWIHIVTGRYRSSRRGGPMTSSASWTNWLAHGSYYFWLGLLH